MISKERLKSMIKYIRQLESGILKVNKINICDQIKMRRYTTEKGNKYIKIIIKLPKEEEQC